MQSSFYHWNEEHEVLINSCLKHACPAALTLRDLSAVGAEVVVVRAPKSGASFWNLGNFGQQMENARSRTALALQQLPVAKEPAA